VELLPGAWDRVEALRPGSRLVITPESGGRVEGALRELRPNVLVLTDSAGREFTLTRREVQRIVGVESDGRTNGVVIGAGIGLGAALAIVAGLGAGDGYVLPSAKWGAPLLLSSAGGLWGAFIDSAHKRERLLYVAPPSGAH
jgi:hypothetical protein